MAEYKGSGLDITQGEASFPVAASTIIEGGVMVAVNASGYAVEASADNALFLVGRCRKRTDNSTGNAGDVSVWVEQGIFYFDNATGSGAVVAADLERTYCYATDDRTVSKSAGAGVRPVAGVPKRLGSAADATTNKVAVQIPGTTSAVLSPSQLSPSGASQPFFARNVAAAGNVADLAAFTVAGNDGVTNVEGDVVVLLEQTTAAACGPYVVGAVSGGAAPLTRPDWWRTGMTLPGGVEIKLGPEGTVFKNCTLKAMVAAKSFVVGTTDPALYPVEVNVAATLVAGTVTLSTIPVFSLNTQVLCSRKAANTSTATTGGYHATVAGANGLTAGKRGTAAIVIEATVAAGTINNADISTLHVTVKNGQS